jgi:hypothetical protein
MGRWLHRLTAGWCAALIVPLALGVYAQAQDSGPGIYHVQASTAACVNPTVTHALTNPANKRLSNPAWVKAAYQDGHCVTVTPASPWKLNARDGDLALMSYAGTTGAPGSYWFLAAVLVDDSGRRLSDIAPAANDKGAGALGPHAGDGLTSDASGLFGATSEETLIYLWGGVIVLIVGSMVIYMIRSGKRPPPA